MQNKFNNLKLIPETMYVNKIAKKVDTPFYLYSQKKIVNNFNNFKNIFKSVEPLICFSVKSNSNLSILKLLKTLGSGADVVSMGELLKVIKSGIKPEKIVFSGVGKSYDELEFAIKKKILLINIESENEAILINKISKKLGVITSIGIRLNPNIKASTHKKISTGKADDKFGISKNDTINFCNRSKNLKNIKIEAISVHIGSQILSDAPYMKTLTVVESILKKTNIKFNYIDLGGGFGIPYTDKQERINLINYSKKVKRFKTKNNCKIIFEPGRAIVGNAGVLITKIQYLKKLKNKMFVILDAGMNDLMRPALYDALHNIVPIKKNKVKINKTVEFVGPICETACKFIKYKNYQKLNENDFLAILDVGAYGSSLASNYNTRPLAAEVMVDKKKIKIIKKRQNLQKLILE